MINIFTDKINMYITHVIIDNKRKYYFETNFDNKSF